MKSWSSTQEETLVESAPSPPNSTFSGMFYEKFDLAYNTMVDEIKPVRDMWDGFFSAYHVAWTGYYQGFSGLFFEYPLEGYTKDGVGGFFTGTAFGLVHFTSMTTSGIVAGLYQAVRGMERTFEALRASKQGKVWDNIAKTWFFYSLDDEATQMDAEVPKKKPSTRRLRKRVKDWSFYEILGVSVDASSADIKRAYYRQALEVHPDKSSESEAADHFRTLNTVYKTLVSEDTRELYDTHGVCYADHQSDNPARIDPYTFFSILFGTGVVEPYVGDLAIASIVDNTLMLTDRAEPQVSLEDSDYGSPQQVRRQVEIATHLRDRIDGYVSGQRTLEEFTTSCRTESQSLAMAMEGNLQADFLLRAMSSGLVAVTTRYVVPSWTKPLLGWVYGVFDATQNLKVVHDLEKAIKQAVARMDDNVNDGPTKDQSDECDRDRKEGVVDALLQKLSVPRMLKLVWKFNVNDISRTMREATKRVLDDCADNHELRFERAKALNILGLELFSAVGKRRGMYGEEKEDYPDAETIQENVKSALFESVISNSFTD